MSKIKFAHIWFQVGKEFEDEIFEGLRKATKNILAQNTVVLSGLKLKDANSLNESGEIDFLAWLLVLGCPGRTWASLPLSWPTTASTPSSFSFPRWVLLTRTRAVLWIRNDFFRIWIRLFRKFRIRLRIRFRIRPNLLVKRQNQNFKLKLQH